MWVAFRCPVNVCRRPFFAIYHETPPDPYGADYRLFRLAPSTPGKWVRSSTIDAISPNFYDIMDQAFAAEKHGLSLIAGMGYRKALEFLVKDYVSEDDRNRLAEAESRGDTTDAELRRTAIADVQNEFLSASIKRIADPRVRAIAERCSWLGNDECHYTKVWTKMDVSDLKTLLSLVTNFIEAESAAAEMLERMPKKT